MRSVSHDDNGSDARGGSASGRRVLVLNRNWQAVNIVGLKRAFGLLWQDHAKAINTFDGTMAALGAMDWLEFSHSNHHFAEGDYVRTIRMNILLPKVLLLTSYDRLPISEVKFNRQSVFERDNFTCQYSGKVCKPKDLTLDHVIPRERGGRTSWENIVTCSREMNARKANRLPHEAGMTLLRRPRKPSWRPFVSVAAGSDIDPAWVSFLQFERAG